MIGRLLRGFSDDRHVQATPDRLGDLSARHSLFRDRVISAASFVLLQRKPVQMGNIENMRRQFGLDQPLWVQYWHFMASLAVGDFGQSFYYRTPVLDLYFQRLPNSLLLAAVAMALSLLIGIPSGILAAVRVDGFWDSAGKIFALLGLSLAAHQ